MLSGWCSPWVSTHVGRADLWASPEMGCWSVHTVLYKTEFCWSVLNFTCLFWKFCHRLSSGSWWIEKSRFWIWHPATSPAYLPYRLLLSSVSLCLCNHPCPFEQSINSEYFIALLICLHVLFHPLPGLFYTLNSSHLIFLMHGERHLSSYLHCQSSSSSVLIQVCPYSRFPIHKSSSQRCDRTHHVLKSWKILKSRSSRVWTPSEGWDWGAWHVFSLPVLILVFVAAETFWRSKSVLCLWKKRMFC